MTDHRRVLVLFFHPTHRASRVGKALVHAASTVKNVTVRDMYALYPDYIVDVKKEQQLLEEHDLIVFQHPIYWYSCPPLLKLWIDEVFEYGWAFGTEGTKLHGKKLLSAVSAGGSREVYSTQGANRFELKTFLSPFDQTAHLCGMRYQTPFVVHNARGLSDADVQAACAAYVELLIRYVELGELP